MNRVLVRLVEPKRDAESVWLSRVPAVGESVIIARKGASYPTRFVVDKVIHFAASYENAVSHIEADCIGTFGEAHGSAYE